MPKSCADAKTANDHFDAASDVTLPALSVGTRWGKGSRIEVHIYPRTWWSVTADKRGRGSRSADVRVSLVFFRSACSLPGRRSCR